MGIPRIGREKLPMEYNDDWKEAIFEAAERATNLRLVQACEAAYKEYQTREELGLQHEILLDEKRIKGEEERRAHFMEEMRKAKILNGEQFLNIGHGWKNRTRIGQKKTDYHGSFSYIRAI